MQTNHEPEMEDRSDFAIGSFVNDAGLEASREVLIDESEDQLIERAQRSLSECRWTIGECALKWTKRYARGRSDADFGLLIGLSGDQVYQRRRVWETFSGVRDRFPHLKWSHFYVALTWDDAVTALDWANETQSSVAEMKAWRRATRGEDLTLTASDDVLNAPFDSPGQVHYASDPTTITSVPDVDFDRNARQSRTPEEFEMGRELNAEPPPYSPFRADAAAPGPTSTGPESRLGVLDRPAPSTEQLVKRMTTSLERCSKVFTPEFIAEYRKLPENVRLQFMRAVTALQGKVSGLQ